jgi:hypothetical protein
VGALNFVIFEKTRNRISVSFASCPPASPACHPCFLERLHSPFHSLEIHEPAFDYFQNLEMETCHFLYVSAFVRDPPLDRRLRKIPSFSLWFPLLFLYHKTRFVSAPPPSILDAARILRVSYAHRQTACLAVWSQTQEISSSDFQVYPKAPPRRLTCVIS